MNPFPKCSCYSGVYLFSAAVLLKNNVAIELIISIVSIESIELVESINGSNKKN